MGSEEPSAHAQERKKKPVSPAPGDHCEPWRSPAPHLVHPARRSAPGEEERRVGAGYVERQRGSALEAGPEQQRHGGHHGAAQQESGQAGASLGAAEPARPSLLAGHGGRPEARLALARPVAGPPINAPKPRESPLPGRGSKSLEVAEP